MLNGSQAQLDERTKLEFLVETILLSQFEHENVIHLEALSMQSEPPMIVTEFMENGQLDYYLRVSGAALGLERERQVYKSHLTSFTFAPSHNKNDPTTGTQETIQLHTTDLNGARHRQRNAIPVQPGLCPQGECLCFRIIYLRKSSGAIRPHPIDITCRPAA